MKIKTVIATNRFGLGARPCALVTRRLAMDDDAPTWNEGDFIGDKFGQE